MTGVYVFAFTNEPRPPLRHGTRRIEFIELEGIHAAVEALSARPAISETELRVQHEIVVRIADSVGAILPVRFGALLDRQELQALVAMRRAEILNALELVVGRVQMTVRVFASNERPESGNAERSGPAASGTAYLAQRQLKSDLLTGEAAVISATVRSFVHDERKHRGQGRIEWTLYHLVDRTAVSRYNRAIEPSRSSAVSVTGPWPPFAFVPDLWP